MKDVNKIIGDNLKQLREERGYSLGTLADMVQVSKSMLFQIEKGETNPSVGTIWKIANGLRVSFTSLLNEDVTPFKVVRKENLSKISQEDEMYTIYPYFPYDRDKRFEMYTFELEPNAKHDSEAHVKGVEEFFIVTHGQMTMIIGSKKIKLSQGDAITFKADKSHAYINDSDVPARGTILLYYQD
ncbi:MAG: helix-turn-helix transcriptional regulator [Clostridia bacterium]|nr:helix-turn-helix transcriptional regulator [Clostridia bacterium]